MPPEKVCFAMPSVPPAPAPGSGIGSSCALGDRPRFVLTGGGAFNAAGKQTHDVTPPHSALAVAHALAQGGSKGRQGLADQSSPVRPLMSFDLKLTSSAEQGRGSALGPSPSETTPMRQRAVNVGDDGNTPRRVRLITPRPNHQLFGRIFFDEKYQRDVRESENVENFGVVDGTPMLVGTHPLSPAIEPARASLSPVRPVAKRPATPASSGVCTDAAKTRTETAADRDDIQPDMDREEPPVVTCHTTPPAPSTDLGLGKRSVVAAQPESAPPGPCGDAERIAHLGDDVEVFFPNDGASDGAWYSGVLRARRGRDGAYGVLFAGTVEWDPWAEWIVMTEVNAGRLRRKNLVTVRAESVPLKLKLKLKSRRPDGADAVSNRAQEKRIRKRPNVKLTVGGKRKRRKG